MNPDGAPVNSLSGDPIGLIARMALITPRNAFPMANPPVTTRTLSKSPSFGILPDFYGNPATALSV